MATHFDNHWQLIATSCIERIKHHKTASINSVIEFLIQEQKVPDEIPTYEDLLIIEGMVISNQRYKADRYENSFNVTLSHKNWIERNQTLYSVLLVFFTSILTLVGSVIADEWAGKPKQLMISPLKAQQVLLLPDVPDTVNNPVQKQSKSLCR